MRPINWFTFVLVWRIQRVRFYGIMVIKCLLLLLLNCYLPDLASKANQNAIEQKLRPDAASQARPCSISTRTFAGW